MLTRRASLRRPAEGSFHLAAHPDGRVGGVEGYVPAQRLALSNVAVAVYAIGAAKGQVVLCQGEGSLRLLAPDQKTAFAIEHLAPLKRPLGDRGDIRIETDRHGHSQRTLPEPSATTSRSARACQRFLARPLGRSGFNRLERAKGHHAASLCKRLRYGNRASRSDPKNGRRPCPIGRRRNFRAHCGSTRATTSSWPWTASIPAPPKRG